MILALQDTNKPAPRFQPGELVHHRRYGYRGVVVGSDPACRADDEWYHANLTQPDRDQPWYHVLVDGSAHATYVAEENLEPDSESRPVEHPLLNKFFDGFRDGRHIRNSTPWVMS